MSIKQTGGVFGRNPTFNDVTIEGQLTFDGDIDINSDLKVDGDLDVTGKGTFSDLNVTDAGNTYVRVKSTTSAFTGVDFGQSFGGSGTIIVRDNHPLLIFTNGVETWRFDTAGNLKVKNSGNGIDFSATAGTGTSELLDDYEEGAWTPVIVGTTAAGVGTYSRQYGYYTKVGNTVTVNIALTWSAHTGTGNMRIEGLPFNTFAHPNNTVVAVGAIVPSGITYSNEIRIAARRNSAQIVIYSVGTGLSQADVPIDTAGSIYASMTYQTDD